MAGPRDLLTIRLTECLGPSGTTQAPRELSEPIVRP